MCGNEHALSGCAQDSRLMFESSCCDQTDVFLSYFLKAKSSKSQLFQNFNVEVTLVSPVFTCHRSNAGIKNLVDINNNTVFVLSFNTKEVNDDKVKENFVY